MTNPAVPFAVLYFAILLVHFLYASFCLKTGRVDLSMGSIRSPFAILSGLTLLNGISLLAFVFVSPLSIGGHAGLHAILAADEVIRTHKARQRWVFLVNHLLWVALLVVWFRVSQS